MTQERVNRFIEKFPNFLPTVKRLDENNIPWAIGGSGCLFLLGNEREPGDADISVLSSDHDKVDTLFNIKSFTHSSNTEEVRNSNPFNDHDIQITSSIIFKINGKKYDCSLMKETLNHLISLPYKNVSVYLKAPEDVLLIKALLQRGPEVGKNDVQDIKNFLQIYKSLDQNYLNQRIADLHAEERVGNSFQLSPIATTNTSLSQKH